MNLDMKELLKLARESIETELNRKELKISEDIKKKFSEKRACFVTLSFKDNDELRGCIGSLLPRQELWKDVVENAKNAAFSDQRFPSLSKSELDKIKIEISILTIPTKINYKSENELRNKIMIKGVILRKGFYSATYLPQVWEDLPDFNEFISSLCSKAGLSSNAWKNLDLEVLIYEVDKIEE